MKQRLQLNQKYFPWGECAVLSFQELRTGWANLCWEGQQDSCRRHKLCSAPLARFSPCSCACASLQVACPDCVLSALTLCTSWLWTLTGGCIPSQASSHQCAHKGLIPGSLFCSVQKRYPWTDPFNAASLRPAGTSLSRPRCSCAVMVRAQSWLFLPILLKNWHTSSVCSWSGIPFYGKPVRPSAEGNCLFGRGGSPVPCCSPPAPVLRGEPGHPGIPWQGSQLLQGSLASPIPCPPRCPTKALSKPVWLLNGNISQPKPVPQKISGWL